MALADLQIGAEDVGQLGSDAESDGGAADGDAIAVAFEQVGQRRRPRAAGVFAGLNRSAVHCLHARTIRDKLKSERNNVSSSQGFHKLADAWDNRHGLRAGEFVDRSTAVSERERKRLAEERQLHPNTFLMYGILRVAWCSTGGQRCDKEASGSVGMTSHDRACMSITAQILKELLIEKVSALMEQCASGQCRSLYILRHHDATPVFCEFGSLAQQVVPLARYLIKVEARNPQGWRWKACRSMSDDDVQDFLVEDEAFAIWALAPATLGVSLDSPVEGTCLQLCQLCEATVKR